MCAAVEPLTQEANLALRSAAIDALGRWGTAETVSVLTQILDEGDPISHAAAIRALGRIPTAESATALANLVPNVADRGNAVAALRQLGPFAEAATLPLLKHPDHMVRYEACNILGDVGGTKALAAMKKQVKTDQHVWSRTAADIALKKLASKPQTPAKSKSTGSSKSSASKSSGSKTNSKTKRPEDDDSFGKD